MWYIIKTEEDNSLTIVERKLLTVVEGVEVEEGVTVTFFYRGRKYSGVVLAFDEDYERMNSMLKKTAAKRPAPKQPAVTTSGKRPIRRAGGGAATSAEEKQRAAQIQQNKVSASRKANADLLAKRQDDDSDWKPDSAQTSDSEGSEMEFQAHLVERQRERHHLVKEINAASRSGSTSPITAASKKPADKSKEELAEENMVLKARLAILYDVGQKEGVFTEKKAEKVAEKVAAFSTLGKGIKEDYFYKKSDSSKQSNPAPDDSLKMNDSLNMNDALNTSEVLSNDDDGSDGIICSDKTDVKSTSTSGCEKNSDLADPENSLDDVKILPDNEEFSELDYQLYGKLMDTKLLGYEIYCKKTAIAKALAGSTSVQHVARRLMEGVFVPSKIQDCTVTGQNWRAGGEARKSQDVKPLHPKALRAIAAYANGVALKNGWATKKLPKLRPFFTSRLAEIKTLFKKGTLKD